MKLILATIAISFCLSSGFAGQRFDAAAWRNVQTYDVPTLRDQAPSLIDRIVAVRFQCRSPKLRHRFPSWYEAALWQHDPREKKGFAAVRVLVAKNDVPAFESITSDFKSTAEITVYGRVEKDPDSYTAYFHILGRKVTMDAAGNATIDW
ncbi:MAG: hypothetical protein ACJ8EL_05205 [Rhizomicrobium sp.]